MARGTCWLRRCKLPRWSIPSPAAGCIPEPSLVEGLVDENLVLTEREQPKQAERVISSQTAAFLQKAMRASIEYGTSKKGKPSANGAGAKTSTAETGQIVEGQQVAQSWISGFYPASNPKYVITVFAEDGVGGGTSCGRFSKKSRITCRLTIDFSA